MSFTSLLNPASATIFAVSPSAVFPGVVISFSFSLSAVVG
jgi:hypothetical protein